MRLLRPGRKVNEFSDINLPAWPYCQRRGWDIRGEYVDVGVSGAKEKRPQLDRLLIAIRRREVDAVAIWNLDRFGRSLKRLVNLIAEWESLGIIFVSLRDNLDFSTPGGRLMFNIIAAMAEFERDLIRERVKAGIARAKADPILYPTICATALGESIEVLPKL